MPSNTSLFSVEDLQRPSRSPIQIDRWGDMVPWHHPNAPTPPSAWHSAHFIGLAASGVNEEEKEVRRFTLVTLRNYGFGKTTMQDALLQEASNLIEGFKRKLGVPFDPRNDFTTAAGNIISGMLMGKQFQEGDEGFRTASESITEALQIGAKAIVEDAFPVMKLISNAKRKMHQHFGIAESYIKNIINEHVSSRVPDRPRDFIDTWLDQEEKSSNRTAQPAFLRFNLPAVVVDIFTGGFETTATSFQWWEEILRSIPTPKRKNSRKFVQWPINLVVVLIPWGSLTKSAGKAFSE